ncbi:hypothetical protein Hanom_Chr09g00776851 [Helianthus anomalus]
MTNSNIQSRSYGEGCILRNEDEKIYGTMYPKMKDLVSRDVSRFTIIEYRTMKANMILYYFFNMILYYYFITNAHQFKTIVVDTSVDTVVDTSVDSGQQMDVNRCLKPLLG